MNEPSVITPGRPDEFSKAQLIAQEILESKAIFTAVFAGESGSGKSQANHNLMDSLVAYIYASNIGIIQTSQFTTRIGYVNNTTRVLVNIATDIFRPDRIGENLQKVLISASYVNKDLFENDGFEDDDDFEAVKQATIRSMIAPDDSKDYDYSCCEAELSEKIDPILSRLLTSLPEIIQTAKRKFNIAKKQCKTSSSEKKKSMPKLKDMLSKEINSNLSSTLENDFTELVRCFDIVPLYYTQQLQTLPLYQADSSYWGVFELLNPNQVLSFQTVMRTIYSKGFEAIIDCVDLMVPGNKALCQLAKDANPQLQDGDILLNVLDVKGSNHNISRGIEDTIATIRHYKPDYCVVFLKANSSKDHTYNLLDEIYSNFKDLPVDVVISQVDRSLKDKVRNINQRGIFNSLKQTDATIKAKRLAWDELADSTNELHEKLKQNSGHMEICSLVEDTDIDLSDININLYDIKRFSKLIYDRCIKATQNYNSIKIRGGSKAITLTIDPIILDQITKYCLNQHSKVKHQYYFSYLTQPNFHPYWLSVYALRDKITINTGHTTDAYVYDDFSINISSMIRSYLPKQLLKQCISIQVNNVLDASKFIDAFNKNFDAEIDLSSIAYHMSYVQLKQEFAKAGYGTYRTIFTNTLKLYSTSLSDYDYVKRVLEYCLITQAQVIVNKTFIR